MNSIKPLTNPSNLPYENGLSVADANPCPGRLALSREPMGC